MIVIEDLGELLKDKNALDKARITMGLFSCKRDSDIEGALHPDPALKGEIPIVQWQKEGVLKTYLIIDNSLSSEDAAFILGYFSLSLCTVLFPKDQFERLQKETKLPYDGYENAGLDGYVPCQMLALFGKNDAAPESFTMKEIFTKDIVPIFQKVDSLIGCPRVVLDVDKTEPGLVQYYRTLHFFEFVFNAEAPDELEKMIGVVGGL
jgi:hypothetical protein